MADRTMNLHLCLIHRVCCNWPQAPEIFFSASTTAAERFEIPGAQGSKADRNGDTIEILQYVDLIREVKGHSLVQWIISNW